MAKETVTKVFVEGRDYLELESFYGSRLAITLKTRDTDDKFKEADLHLVDSQIVELAMALLEHYRNVKGFGGDRRQKAELLYAAAEEIVMTKTS